MRPWIRTVITTTALLFLPAPSGRAQTVVNPAGHWEGAIQAPEMLVQVEIDLTVNAKGQFAGTFAQPSDGIKGLPLSSIQMNGRSLQLLLRPGGSGGGSFEGKISDDGQSFAGDFITAEGGFKVPFSLTRKGDARIAPAPKNRAIPGSLEGRWSGALDVGGRQMRLTVVMANASDGSAAGTIVSPDGTGVEIPIAMSQVGSDVTIEVPSVGAAFAGIMNAAGTEIAGTWKEAKATLPLTLKKIE